MPTRLAAIDDVPALVRVINRAYVVEAHLFHGDRTDEAEVRERLERPNACFLVIDAPDGGPAPARWPERCSWRFAASAATSACCPSIPDWQGRGLARQLISAAEAHATAARCDVMDIDVVDLRTELPGFYTMFGYVPAGSTPYASETREGSGENGPHDQALCGPFTGTKTLCAPAIAW